MSIVLFAVGTAGPVASSQEAGGSGQSGDLKDDVLEWVDQLDADRLSTRKAAEQSLIEAGTEILDLLPDSPVNLSAEAALRLSRVRRVLRAEQAKTESAAVRVDLSDVSTLGGALEAISRDSKTEFEYATDASLPVSAVETPLPFWQALDHVLDETNLEVDFYGADRGSLRLTSRKEERPNRTDAAAYAGVYRIEPTSVIARRVLTNPSLSGLNIGIEIAWEPRLTPIGLTIPTDQLSSVLDNEKNLEPQESGGTIDVATSGDLAFSEFFLPMQLPARGADSIQSLSGVVRAILPGKEAAFRLPLAKADAKTTLGAMTVEVEQVRPSGPLHEIRIGVELEDANRALESHRHWIFENEAYLEREDGSRVEHLGYEVYRQSNRGVGVGYLFDVGGSLEDATLVYKSPTTVVQNEVPFVLQDIPLP